AAPDGCAIRGAARNSPGRARRPRIGTSDSPVPLLPSSPTSYQPPSTKRRSSAAGVIGATWMTVRKNPRGGFRPPLLPHPPLTPVLIAAIFPPHGLQLHSHREEVAGVLAREQDLRRARAGRRGDDAQGVRAGHVPLSQRRRATRRPP